jgi:hypothetical protein
VSLRIELEVPIGAAPVRAWMHIPHESPHRKDLYVHEVLTTRVNVPLNQKCRVRIDGKVLQVPYFVPPLNVVI